MGKKGIEILTLDVNELIRELNRALSEEWLAYYQYWIGAKVVKGPMSDDIKKEFIEHAEEELSHADMIADRITQLGGTPILSPNEWMNNAGCKYLAPVDPKMLAILKQNLSSERCAIQRYQNIADMTQVHDYITFNIVTQILKEELEHEEDIESWLDDIQVLKEEVLAH